MQKRDKVSRNPHYINPLITDLSSYTVGHANMHLRNLSEQTPFLMCSNFYLSSQLQLLLSEVISPWLRFNCLSAHAVKCRLNAQVPKGCVSSVAAACSAVTSRQLVLCGRQTVQRARRSFAEYSCPVKLANLQKSGCHVWYTHFLPRTPPSPNHHSFSFLDSCSFSGIVLNKKKYRAFSYFRDVSILRFAFYLTLHYETNLSL